MPQLRPSAAKSMNNTCFLFFVLKKGLIQAQQQMTSINPHLVLSHYHSHLDDTYPLETAHFVASPFSMNLSLAELL